MTAMTDPGDALAAFVAGAGDVIARAAPLDAVTRDAAVTDPDADRIHRLHERMRTESYRQVIDRLVAMGGLRRELDAAEATDVLLTLLGSDLYLAFTRDRGWSHDRTMTWLAATLSELLLAAETRDRGPASAGG